MRFRGGGHEDAHWLVVMLAVQGRALTLAELERMAVAASPSLAQSQSEVRAAAGRALQAGLYPNPVLGASGDQVSRADRFCGAAISADLSSSAW